MIYSSVVVPNIHEYVRRGMDPNFPERLLAEWRDIGSGFSEVSLFWEGEGKLVISPKPIDSNFIDYIKQLLEYKELFVVTPKNYTSEFCRDILNDELTLSEIVSYVKNRNSVHFLPWGATESVYLLLETLQERGADIVSEELPSRDYYWTSLHFDSKVGFRELCASLRQIDSRIQIPTGFTCNSLSEAIELLRWFYARRTPCVLKASMGVSGFGNVFLYGELFEQSFDNVAAYVKDAIRELPYFTHGAAVVEKMIITESSDIPASQLCPSSVFMNGVILSDGGVEIVGGGAEIRDKRCYYVGAEVGKDTLLDSVVTTLEPIMYRIGEAISEHGYRGQWGVDFVISTSGIPIAIELNARRCSSSHVYAMVKRFYGKEWMSACYAISRLPYYVQVAPEVSIDAVLCAFEKTNAMYKKDRILAVPTQVSWLHQTHPGIGYTLFGTNKSRVKSAECYLRKRLSAHGIQDSNK